MTVSDGLREGTVTLVVPACTVSLSQAKSSTDGAGFAVVGFGVVCCAEVVGFGVVCCAEVGLPEVGWPAVCCADVPWPEVGLEVDGFVVVDVGTGFVVSRPEVGFGADVVGCADVPWPDVGWPAVGLLSDVGFAVEVGLPKVGVAEVGCEVLGSEEPGVDGFVVVAGVVAPLVGSAGVGSSDVVSPGAGASVLVGEASLADRLPSSATVMAILSRFTLASLVMISTSAS